MRFVPCCEDEARASRINSCRKRNGTEKSKPWSSGTCPDQNQSDYIGIPHLRRPCPPLCALDTRQVAAIHIPECVSQRLGECQVHRVAGMVVSDVGFQCSRIDFDQGKSRSSTVWISPSHFFSDTS